MENLRHQQLKIVFLAVALIATVFSIALPFFGSITVNAADFEDSYKVVNTQSFLLDCKGTKYISGDIFNSYRYTLPVYFRFSTNLFYSTANPTSSVANAIMIQSNVVDNNNLSTFSQLVMNNYSTDWTTVQKAFSVSVYDFNYGEWTKTPNVNLNIAYRYTDVFIDEVYSVNASVTYDYYTLTENSTVSYTYSNYSFDTYNDNYLFSFYNNSKGLLCQVAISTFQAGSAYGKTSIPRFFGQTFIFGDGSVTSASYNEGYIAGINESFSRVDTKSASYLAGKNKGYNEGVTDAGNYTFFSLISSVIDVPIQALVGLLDFNLFGIDMSALYLSLFTLCIVITVIKLLL